MTYYTKKTDKKQHLLYTNHENCSKNSRCNNPKICPTCAKLQRNRNFNKFFGHLNEEHINNYKYKYFIRFKNNDLNLSTQEKNHILNFFTNSFLKSKQNKNFIIDSNVQYMVSKEISYSEELGYNPHTHMILLTNKKFDPNNKQFKKLLELNNISFHVEEIYKKKNSFLESIKSIFNYVSKFEEKRAELEKQSNITKNENKIRVSNIFRKNKIKEIINTIKFKNFKEFIINISDTKENKERCLYIQIKERYNQKIKEAKTTFKRNSNKKHTKNYIRLLKSLRKKLKLLNSQQNALFRLLKAKKF